MRNKNGFTVVMILIGTVLVLTIAAASYVVVRDYRHNKTTPDDHLVSTSLAIQGFPFPSVPSSYQLIDQTSSRNDSSLPYKEYVTSEGTATVLSYTKSICATNGFKLEPVSTGQTSVNNGPIYTDTTLHCYKGSDGWQFDIAPTSSLAGSSLTNTTVNISSASTVLTVQSIGPPVCNCPNISVDANPSDYCKCGP